MAETFTLGILLRLRDAASRGVKAALGGIERLGDEVDATHQEVAKLETGFRQLRDAGLGLAGMGTAAAGALVAVLKPAATLEAQVKNTLTLTGATGDAFARMERDMTQRALTLSTILGIAAADIAEAFYQVLSSGAEALTPQFDALADTALKMAKTVGLAPAEAVEILSDTLHAFERDVTAAERVADQFFTTSRLTATTVPQLTEAMREAGPAAAAVGQSLEETLAILAGFAAKGTKGAKAGTAFRMILTRLAKPPAEAARALRFLDVAVFDSTGTMRPMIAVLQDLQTSMAGLSGAQQAAVLKAIAGEEAFAKLGGLLESNLDTLTGWRQTLVASEGALELAFGQKMAAASAQVQILWVAVKNLAIGLGQPLLTALARVAGSLARVIQGVAAFAQAHPILGKTVGVVLAVVSVLGLLAGSVLTVTGVLGLFTLKWLPLARTGMTMFSLATFKDLAVRTAHTASVVAGTAATWAHTVAAKAAAAAQWLWNAALTANPLGLILVGVAALVAGIVLLVKHWDAVTAAVQGAWQWFRNLLDHAPDWLLALVFPLGLLIKHFDTVQQVAGQVFGAVRRLVGALVGWIAAKWGTLRDILLAPVRAVRRVWTALRDAVVGVLQGIWDRVLALLARVPDVLLPAGLEALKRTRPAVGLPVGGQLIVSATAPAGERATPRPTVPREPGALPAFAAATAGGPIDQSITIHPGAIQIHAVRVDDRVIRQIDFELARLLRRRQERR